MGLLDKHKGKDKEDGRRILSIALSDIEVDVNQVRKNFFDVSLEKLSDSIDRNGLQNPIHVFKINDKYRIITGERRFRATGMIKNATMIDCIVHDSEPDGKNLRVLQLTENLLREDLNVIEMARGFCELIEQKMSQRKIAEKLSISENMVSRGKKIIEVLPDDWISKLNELFEEKGNSCLTMYELYKVANLNKGNGRTTAFNKLLSDKGFGGDKNVTEASDIKRDKKEKVEYPDAKEFWDALSGLVTKLKRRKKGEEELVDLMKKHLSARKAQLIINEYNNNV